MLNVKSQGDNCMRYLHSVCVCVVWIAGLLSYWVISPVSSVFFRLSMGRLAHRWHSLWLWQQPLCDQLSWLASPPKVWGKHTSLVTITLLAPNVRFIHIDSIITLRINMLSRNIHIALYRLSCIIASLTTLTGLLLTGFKWRVLLNPF